MTGPIDSGSTTQNEVEGASHELGRILHRLRTEASIAISALSTMAGVSPGLISQIERGIGNPSYMTLIKLAQALKVPVGSFFGVSEAGVSPSRLVRRDKRRRLLISESHMIYELLTPTMNGRLAMLEVQIPAGWTNEAAPYSHEGEEVVLLVSGELFINVGGDEYVVGAGDSLTYDASLPHWYRNDGVEPAMLIGAMTPPSF